MCTSHYRRRKEHGDALSGPVIAFKRSPGKGVNSLEDALRYYTPQGLSECACHEWLGTRDDRGYGLLSYGPRKSCRMLKAHRLAWEASNGVELPSDVSILHSCDNPPCVNPRHLRPDTHQENMREAKARNRLVRGVDVINARLTPSIVREMRSLRYTRGMSNYAIALEYGVSVGTVWNAVSLRGRTWRHVEFENHPSEDT